MRFAEFAISFGHFPLDDVLWINFFAAILNEAFRSPDHKTCFSFALGCTQHLHFPIHFCPFSPVSTQPHQNSQAWCKSCGHFRENSKHVLRSGDLKASLRIATEKLIHKTSSNVHRPCSTQNFVTFIKVDLHIFALVSLVKKVC